MKRLIALCLALVLSLGTLTVLGPMTSASSTTISPLETSGPVQMTLLQTIRDFYNKHYEDKVYIDKDEALSVKRLRYISGDWYLNTNGEYPYVLVKGDVPSGDSGTTSDDTGAQVPAPPSISRNKFTDARSIKNPSIVVSYNALSEACVKINDEGIPCTIKLITNTQYGICRTDYPNQYYTNASNQAFVAVDDRSVTNVDFDYIYNDNSVDNSQHLTVDDMKILDINNNTMNLINDKGQTTNYTIESLYYDASTKSYTANVYNTLFNTTNNYYEYNYYTYNISYNITNTYVTYIGSTAEYTEPYEYYFELPDGRSSADMTAEEVEGISLAFDVCNYAQVATDTHTQSLYHFDGDWKDSSFYSEQTKLTWGTGASITYLDSNAFGGCLYLDNTAHRFNAYIPDSSLFAGDFTLQFRLYCGATATSSVFSPDGLGTYTKNGSSCFIGGSGELLLWDSSGFYVYGKRGYSYNNLSDGYAYYKVAPLPIGSWIDVVFEVAGSTQYIFINGIRYTISPNMNVLSMGSGRYCTFSPMSVSSYPYVSFYVPKDLFSFTYLDELRIVDFPVYTKNFEPSPVPFDTNNVFVLPETEDLKDLTIAVQSAVPVKGYRVGGVRPTFPDRGMVYLPVENGRAIDCQIYNGTNWESVECRLWTGSRWIPMWAFDILTLSDCWDISDGTGVPPITTETGFWSWWQKEWLDFRAWFTANLGGSGGGPIIFPPMSDCEHTYTKKVLTAPTCTMKGSALYTCSKCGDSYTDTLDANGHDWLMKESIPDELDEDGAVVVAGYDLYVCSVCGEDYFDYARTGPPGEEDGSTLTQLIQQLFESLGGLVGSLIDWVLELAVDAVKGFGDLGDYFKEKAGEIEGFGGEFIGFLGAFFTIIPPEIMTCLSLALVLLGLTLFIRKVLLS